MVSYLAMKIWPFYGPGYWGGYLRALRPMLLCVTLCPLKCPKTVKILALKGLNYQKVWKLWSRVCLPSLKKRMGSSLSCRFLEHERNWRNLIGWFRGWKLKNTNFSRKIKTPDWCIYHTGIEMENFFPISLSP